MNWKVVLWQTGEKGSTVIRQQEFPSRGAAAKTLSQWPAARITRDDVRSTYNVLGVGV